MKKEAISKLIVCLILAAILVPSSANLAGCRNMLRFFWNRGHQDTVYLARFYYVVLLALAVIITQNVFLRKTLERIEDSGQQERKP